MSINFNYLLKYIIIGDSGVGKSNILLRYQSNSFKEEFKTTVGVEFVSKTIDLNQSIYRIQIWDTAGQESFRSITRSYYKNSVCACIVYDISNYATFESIQSWIDDCTKQASNTILLFLIGNKKDLSENREVSYDEGEAFAKSHNMMFLETSAKTGENVNEIFDKSIRQIDQNIIDKKYNLDNEACGIRVGSKKDSFALIEEDDITSNSYIYRKSSCCF